MKSLKKSLSLLLALVMAVSCMSVGAMADDEESTSPTTEVEVSTFDDLKAHLENDTTTKVTLTAPVSVEGTITIASKTVELDLNGFVVTNNAGASVRAFELSNSTKFTVTGTKTGSGMVNSDTVDGKTFGFFRIYNKTNAELIVNGGDYIGNTDNGAFVRVSKNSSGTKVTLTNVNVTTDWSIFDNTGGGAVTVVITGGNYVQNNVVDGKGNLDGAGKPVGAFHFVKGTATMTDVKLTSMGGTGVGVEGGATQATFNNCDINITGTENKWASCAIGIGAWSQAIINGGSCKSGLHGVSFYTSGGYLVVDGGAEISGAVDGVAYYYDTGSYYNTYKGYFPDGIPFYTYLLDGTIKNGLGNYNNGVANDSNNYSVLVVEGGKIEGDYTVGGTVDVYDITGGTFDSDPTDYVAEGYEAVDNGDGTWTVQAYVAQIGTTKYVSLEAAIAAAQDGDTIELLSDVTLSDSIDIDKALTIDLNGHSITNAASYSNDYLIAVKRGGNLTVKSSVSGGAITTNSVMCGIKMTILGEARDDASYSASPAKLTVESGSITGDSYAISGNGTRHNTEITINGGTLTGTNGAAIYHPQDGTLTISGGSLTGKDTAVELRSGTLDVTGGTFTATETAYSCNPNGSGTTTKGAALAIAQHTTNKPIVANITGGTYSGEKTISIANPQNNAFNNVTVSSSASLLTDSIVIPEGYEWVDAQIEGCKTLAEVDTFVGYTDEAIESELSTNTNAAVEVTPTQAAIDSGEADANTTYVAYKDANQNVVKTSLTVEVVSTTNTQSAQAVVANSDVATTLVNAANTIDNRPSKSEVKVADLVKAKTLTGSNNEVKLGMSLTLTKQEANRVTFDIHPTVRVNTGAVETLANNYIATSGMTVKMPVPSTWTSVNVYHGSDLVGTYAPKTTTTGETYVEFKGTSFSEYSGEDNSASIGYGAIVYLSGTMGDANSVIIGFDRNPNYPAIGDIQLSIGDRVLNPVDSLNAYNDSRVATYMQVEKPDDASSTTATYYKVKVFAKFINTPVTVKLMNGESELSFYSFGYSGFNTQSIVSSYGVSFVDYARLLSVKNAASEQASYYNAFFSAVGTYGAAIDALVPYLQQAD